MNTNIDFSLELFDMGMTDSSVEPGLELDGNLQFSPVPSKAKHATAASTEGTMDMLNLGATSSPNYGKIESLVNAVEPTALFAKPFEVAKHSSIRRTFSAGSNIRSSSLNSQRHRLSLRKPTTVLHNLRFDNLKYKQHIENTNTNKRQSTSDDWRKQYQEFQLNNSPGQKFRTQPSISNSSTVSNDSSDTTSSNPTPFGRMQSFKQLPCNGNNMSPNVNGETEILEQAAASRSDLAINVSIDMGKYTERAAETVPVDPFRNVDLDHVGDTLLNLHVQQVQKNSHIAMNNRIAALSPRSFRKSMALERLASDPTAAREGRNVSQNTNSSSTTTKMETGIYRSDSIQLLSSAVRGLHKGEKPTAIAVGNLSGVYKLYDGSHSPVAVFKPRDEEFVADAGELEPFELGKANPNYPGLRIGEGALKERAAFLLDRSYGGFSGVPTTTLTRIKTGRNSFRKKSRSGESTLELRASSTGISEHIRQNDIKSESSNRPGGSASDDTCSSEGEQIEGSMQEFVSYQTTVGDLSINVISAKEVRKIAILDIRLFNGDRHGDNILVQTPPDRPKDYANARLIPIDHGSCLPDFRFLSITEFVWWDCKAAKLPFTPNELGHISAIDTAKDASHLRGLGIREECVVTCVICTNLLKMCAKANLTLFQVVSIIRRPYEYAADGTQKSSVLEGWINSALEQCKEYQSQLEEIDVNRAVPAPPKIFFDTLMKFALNEINKLQASP